MHSRPITPVILSGGSGTRLWPVSTDEKPKQFLPLLGGTSLLQQTLERVDDRTRFGPPMVVGGERHAALIADQLDRMGVGDALTVLEPIARNTAAAIAFAAHLAPSPDTLLLVMPSDHAVEDQGEFLRAVERAAPVAADGWLVTFGITPGGPETGFGYIALGEAVAGSEVRRVDRFLEKPDRATAERLLAAGHHVWNAGIFLFRADALLDALARHAPDIADAVERTMAGAERTGSIVRPDIDALETCPSAPVDIAVMERADRVACLPVDMGWSDVGSWDALDEIRSRRGSSGPDDALLIDAEGSSVHSDGGVRVTISGVPDVLVIATGRDVLIIPRGESQRVKAVATHRKSQD